MRGGVEPGWSAAADTGRRRFAYCLCSAGKGGPGRRAAARYANAGRGGRYCFAGRFRGPLPGWSCCGQLRRPRPGPDHPAAARGRREEAGGGTDQARWREIRPCARHAVRQEPASRVAVTVSGTEVSLLGIRRMAPAWCRRLLVLQLQCAGSVCLGSKSVRHAGTPHAPQCSAAAATAVGRVPFGSGRAPHEPHDRVLVPGERRGPPCGSRPPFRNRRRPFCICSNRRKKRYGKYVPDLL